MSRRRWGYVARTASAGRGSAVGSRRMITKGVSFKRALIDAIRDGASGRVDYVFSTTTYEMGAPTVDLDQANRLAADLEDAELVERLRSGR